MVFIYKRGVKGFERLCDLPSHMGSKWKSQDSIHISLLQILFSYDSHTYEDILTFKEIEILTYKTSELGKNKDNFY